jgi:phage FluMu gp28-like protein
VTEAAAPALTPQAEAAPVLARLAPASLLLGYQRLAIDLCNATALAVIEKSRRIGLTWALAARAALRAARSRGAGGRNTYYMGYDAEMAREFISTVGMWAKAFQIAANAAEEIVLADEDGDIKAFRIVFASGFSVTALPSVPRALRGRQGDVIIDEAAFHKDLAEVLKAALALLMWGGSVAVVSTHDGAANPFNQLIDEIKAGRRKGATLRITLGDALADGLYERICLVAGRAATPEGRAAWEAEIRATYGEAAEEELDCVPRPGGGSWLTPEQVAAAEHDEAGRPELYAGGPVYLGRDVARRRDLSVIWAAELVGETLWVRERVELRGASFAEQDHEFERLMRAYRVVRAGVDQTGMGEKVVEDLQARWGATVEGVLFTGPRKLDIATALKDRFERGLIRIPKDAAIRADLRSVKRVAGPSGAPRLAEDGSSDAHADRFWAAALMAAAAGETPMAYTGALHASRAAAASEGAARTTSGRMRMRADEESDVERGTW